MTKRSLLVIDDDIDFNTLIKVFLERNINWKVLTALDGKEGVTKAQSQQPSMILLDVAMPSLNGLEVYHLLKSDPITCSIPIVFLTAMVKMDKIIEWQIAEEVEIISKPFDMTILVNRVIGVCDRYLNANN